MKKNIRENKRYGVQMCYVLDSIIVMDEDGNEIENATDKEKVSYFWTQFEAEYNHKYNQIRYPNIVDRVASYLRGLPASIAIDFENYKIAEIGKSWGFCQTEKKESEFVERWFNVIAFRLVQLKEYFKL